MVLTPGRWIFRISILVAVVSFLLIRGTPESKVESSLAKAQASLAGAPSASLHGSQGVEERHGPPMAHTGPAGACSRWSSLHASRLQGPSIHRVHLA